MSGTWTATVTGPVTLEFNNYRNDIETTNIKNWVDDLRVKPLTPNFATDELHISCTTGQLCTFTLDAGVTYANKSYIIFSGVTSTYPGFSLTGVGVPLNLDVWTWSAFSMINGPLMQSFMASLDGSGQATAKFFAPGPLPPEAIGLPMFFDYILLDNPGGPPALFASHPLYVLFIP